jgi:cytochrome b561
MITITGGHYLGVISHQIIEKDESENRMFPLLKLKQITVN